MWPWTLPWRLRDIYAASLSYITHNFRWDIFIYPALRFFFSLLPCAKLFIHLSVLYIFFFLICAKLFLCLLWATAVLITCIHNTFFLCTNISLHFSRSYLLDSLYDFFLGLSWSVSHFYVLCYWYWLNRSLFVYINLLHFHYTSYLHVFFLANLSSCLCNTTLYSFTRPVRPRAFACYFLATTSIVNSRPLWCSFLLLAP